MKTIEELDKEWDRLDNMGSVPEKQRLISKEGLKLSVFQNG